MAKPFRLSRIKRAEAKLSLLQFCGPDLQRALLRKLRGPVWNADQRRKSRREYRRMAAAPLFANEKANPIEDVRALTRMLMSQEDVPFFAGA